MRQGMLAMVLAVLLAPAAQAASGGDGSGVPFASDSFWNSPLTPLSPVDAQSSKYVSTLLSEVTSNQAKGIGPWIASVTCSVPVYTVGASQPRVRVQVAKGASRILQPQIDSVPLPGNAQPSSCSDHHLTVWQPSTDTLWEFWKLVKVDGHWETTWGGRMDNVSQSPGYFDKKFGATATSLPLLGGLIRLRELQAGHIDHALAFAIANPRRHIYTWPAQRTDGWSTDTGALPEGIRFRLDPTLNLATLNLPPVTRMIAEAAQRYGMVLRDKTARAVTFFAEEPRPLDPAPYNALYGGKTAGQLLASFPWKSLQALPVAGQDCSATPPPATLGVSSFCGFPYTLSSRQIGGADAKDPAPSGSSAPSKPAAKPKPKRKRLTKAQRRARSRLIRRCRRASYRKTHRKACRTVSHKRRTTTKRA